MKFTADSSTSVSAIGCRTVGYVPKLHSQIKETAMCFSNLKNCQSHRWIIQFSLLYLYLMKEVDHPKLYN